MTLSDADEILPLIDHNRRDQGDSNVDYSSLLCSEKQKGFDFLNRKTINTNDNCISENFEKYWNESRTYKNLLRFQDPYDQKITYSWNTLNVYSLSKNSKKSWARGNFRLQKEDRNFFEQPKQILNNVFGVAYPGELLAIMGASGAGKTTLLNALTFQSGYNNVVKGNRCLNGIPIVDRNTISRLSAYVEQENLFIGTLTVKEHLIFQSLVRIDRNASYQQKLKRVEGVITELGLEKCQHTVIGYEGRTKGISGGERKRLSFASEILTNPPIMFCDEPTSGLDSFMALNVINVLKSMAIRGKTVICTIHQPSSEIFSLFDKILLVAEGRTAFLGKTKEAISFFNELGASPPPNFNPADFFIQLLAVMPNQEESCKGNIKLICDSFAQSHQGFEIVNEIQTDTQNQLLRDTRNSYGRYGAMFENGSQKYTYAATWLCQFRALFWRSWINIVKEPLLIKVRLFQTVVSFIRFAPSFLSFAFSVTAFPPFSNQLLTFTPITPATPIHLKSVQVLSLVVGLIYHQQKLNEDGVMNINGVLFTFLTNMTFQNLFAVISVFCNEIPVFMKEQSNKLYRVDTYFLSKTFAEIPMFLAIPIIFTGITYYWIGLNSELYHFAFTILILILITNVATSFGYFISCISTNVVMALSIGPPIIIPFLLFGGFLLNTGAVPKYFKWLSYLSWFKYGNEALLINQWADIKNIECNKSTITCPSSGEIVLEIFHFQKENFWWDLASLLILILLFRFVAFSALFLKAKRYRLN